MLVEAEEEEEDDDEEEEGEEGEEEGSPFVAEVPCELALRRQLSGFLVVSLH